MSRLILLDCVGMRPLLRARDRLPGRLWLRCPSDPVRFTLGVTGQLGTFQLTDAAHEQSHEPD